MRHAAALIALVLAACGSSGSSSSDRAAATPQQGGVAVYLTTADLSQTLARQPDLAFSAGEGSAASAITVDSATQYQALTAGFGVAMTDTSAWLLHEVLPQDQRDAAMDALFSPERGIGLSYLRLGIGGTDFNHDAQPYTYDDLPDGQTDPALARFSIHRDKAYLLPMIRQALALNPAITVVAAPWSPPAWMKTDGQMIPRGPTTTLKSDAYQPLADYFVKFVQAYAAEGVPVHQISLQNEPYNPLLLVAGIPGMFLSPLDEAKLLKNHVAPAFAAAGITAQPQIWDFFYNVSETFIPLVMAQAGEQVGAFAYHCYLSDARAMSIEHALYPDVPEYETECSSNLSNIEPAQMTIRALRNWAQGVQLWNAVLDENLGPKFGNGCRGLPGSPHSGEDCIAPVIVNTDKKTFNFTSDYWALAHFSKFIQLGARRIDSTATSQCIDEPVFPPACGLENVAFENPDGSRVLVATTHQGEAAFSVNEGGAHFDFRLPEGATVTFAWQPE